MTQLTKSIIQKRLQKLAHEENIENIKNQHGNYMASMAGDFSNRYTSSYPGDFDCIGTIAYPIHWPLVTMPPGTKHPKVNPVWDFNMPDECQGMGEHYNEWLFMLIELESENGWPTNLNTDKKEYNVIFSPIEELYTLGNAMESIHGYRGDSDKELFTVGRRVGFVKYPTSRNYDLWMFLDPSQESIDEMEKYYEEWEKMY